MHRNLCHGGVTLDHRVIENTDGDPVATENPGRGAMSLFDAGAQRSHLLFRERARSRDTAIHDAGTTSWSWSIAASA